MMIRIMYSDGRFDMVKQNSLDALLGREKITSFKRSSGWAVIGRDPVRSRRRGEYVGPERRDD